MIRVYLMLAAYLLTPILIIYLFQKLKLVRKIGTVLIAYAVGIVLALTGAVSFAAGSPEALTFSKLQSTLTSIAVPLAIPLMLFNCDFKLWTKALPKTIYSLCFGIIAMLIAVVSGYFIFRNQGIPQFPKVAAMLTGIYTGGTMNFNALGKALGVDYTTLTIVLAFQMVITTPYIFFIIGGGYKAFRKILPNRDKTFVNQAVNDTTAPADIENYNGLFRKKNALGMLAGLGLSILILGISAGCSILFSFDDGVKYVNGEPQVAKLNELTVILLVTTLSIIASFFKKVRELPKTFELGMFFILIFSVVVASMFDINSINQSSMMIGGYILYLVVVALIIHILLCRFGKVEGDLFTVSQVALLCSPPFVPPVVGAMKNKGVLISGIVIGLVGYAVGTYLGVMINFILERL